MMIWMALDPETERIVFQAREFGDTDFPRGRRGLNWPVRQAEMDEEHYNAILRAEMTNHHELLEELWDNSNGGAN